MPFDYYCAVSLSGVSWIFGIGLVIGVASARLLEARGYEFYFKWPFKVCFRKKE